MKTLLLSSVNTMRILSKFEASMPSRRAITGISFKILNISGQLMIIPLVYNHIERVEFGIFSTLNTISLLFINLDLGVVNAIKNPLHKSIHNRSYKEACMIISTSFFFMAFLSFLFLIIIFTIYINDINIKFIENENLLKYRSTTFYASAYFIIRLFFQIIHSYNHAVNKNFINDILLTLSTLLSLISLYILIRTNALTLFNAVNVYLGVPCIIYAGYFIYFFAREDNLVLSIGYFNYSYLKEIITLSVKFFFLQICWIYITNFIPIMLAKSIGISRVGDFNIISRIFNFLYVLNFVLLSNYWAEIAATYLNNNKADLKRIFKKVISISSLFCFGCLIVAAAHKIILSIWLGDSFDISIEFTTIICAYYIFLIVLSTLNVFMNSLNYLRLQIYLSIFNLLLLPILFFIFKDLNGISLEFSILISPVAALLINILLSINFFSKLLKGSNKNATLVFQKSVNN